MLSTDDSVGRQPFIGADPLEKSRQIRKLLGKVGGVGRHWFLGAGRVRSGEELLVGALWVDLFRLDALVVARFGQRLHLRTA